MATRDENQLKTLKASLVDLGPLRRGTVLRRFVPCGKPGCRCQANPPKLHGPYYEWSRKVKGKTVTVRVTPEQARLLEQWIADARRLDKIIDEMQRISERINEIIAERGDHPGLVHIFSAMEPCMSFRPWHDKQTHQTFLKMREAQLPGRH
jgi:hypothetical protein